MSRNDKQWLPLAVTFGLFSFTMTLGESINATDPSYYSRKIFYLVFPAYMTAIVFLVWRKA